jgi:hypothetical protein
MVTEKRMAAMVVCALLCGAPPLRAQNARQTLETVKSLRCEFTLMATGTWTPQGDAQAHVRERKVSMVFTAIDTQEGSAEIEGSSAAPTIIAQLSGGYLHFMQIAITGYLYTTTVFDKVAHAPKLKAVHTRHEYTEVALPGYTSRPEQYYGECEVLP